MNTAEVVTYAILAVLIGGCLILSALDAYETRQRERRARNIDLAPALMEARGQRWAEHDRANRAEIEAGRAVTAKEKAEAQLVEAWRELYDQEERLTDTNTANVIDLTERARR